MNLQSVAPKELIVSDYQQLKSHEHLETDEATQDLILVQSLEGRAHNGAGAFEKHFYVNTTVEDIVKALELDTNLVKQQRQAIINDIYDYATAVMNGEKKDKLINSAGKPILGLEYFLNHHVNPKDVLRGLYMGGLRDNPDYRKEAEKRYNVKIGGGRCYIVNIEKMIAMDLDGFKLADYEHEDKIDSYFHEGLIVSTEGIPDEFKERYYYIRHRIGPGQSDDAAFIMAGLLYNPDVAIGVFLSDAIDTLEKYAPICKDQDVNLSFLIARSMKDLNISLEDVYELIYLSAIPEPEEDFIPDSSLRYLLSIEQKSGVSAFKNHLNFILGKPVMQIPISYRKISSTQLYEYINKRLVNTQKLQKLAMPNPQVHDLDKLASEIMTKDFAVISKDATLAEIIKLFKQTKAEILVVTDKNSKILGIVNATDLLYFFDEGIKHHART